MHLPVGAKRLGSKPLTHIYVMAPQTLQDPELLSLFTTRNLSQNILRKERN